MTLVVLKKTMKIMLGLVLKWRKNTSKTFQISRAQSAQKSSMLFVVILATMCLNMVYGRLGTGNFSAMTVKNTIENLAFTFFIGLSSACSVIAASCAFKTVL